MAKEPTHGEILREIGVMSHRLTTIEENQHRFREEIGKDIATLKEDNNRWKATEQGFNIVRWIIASIVVAIGAMVGVVKVLAGGTG